MKKNQQGNAILISLGIIGLIILLCVISFVSNYNYGNVAEKSLVATYSNMENILAQYSLKVMEAGSVPEMYKDDMKDVMTSVMTARQGEGGSKAAFQWFKEHQINIDASLYGKIQTIIEAGRNKFQNAQTQFIDAKRSYETNLGFLWKGMWLRIAGYPTIDLSEYAIISSGHAKEAFKTKVDKAIKIR
jgi:hypothetical protein